MTKELKDSVTYLKNIWQAFGDILSVMRHSLDEEISHGHVEIGIQTRSPHAEVLRVRGLGVFVATADGVASQQDDQKSE